MTTLAETSRGCSWKYWRKALRWMSGVRERSRISEHSTTQNVARFNGWRARKRRPSVWRKRRRRSRSNAPPQGTNHPRSRSMNGIAFTVPGPPVAKQRKDAWSELELAMLCEHYPRIGQIAVAKLIRSEEHT